MLGVGDWFVVVVGWLVGWLVGGWFVVVGFVLFCMCGEKDVLCRQRAYGAYHIEMGFSQMSIVIVQPTTTEYIYRYIIRLFSYRFILDLSMR